MYWDRKNRFVITTDYNVKTEAEKEKIEELEEIFVEMRKGFCDRTRRDRKKDAKKLKKHLKTWRESEEEFYSNSSFGIDPNELDMNERIEADHFEHELDCQRLDIINKRYSEFPIKLELCYVDGIYHGVYGVPSDCCEAYGYPKFTEINSEVNYFEIERAKRRGMEP